MIPRRAGSPAALSLRPAKVALALTLALCSNEALFAAGREGQDATLVARAAQRAHEQCIEALAGKVEALEEWRAALADRIEATSDLVAEAKAAWESDRAGVATARAALRAAVSGGDDEAAIRSFVAAERAASKSRKEYVRWLAVTTGLLNVLDLADQCLAVAARSPASRPAGPAPAPTPPGTCLTTEGPLGCTGEFDGTYTSKCTGVNINDHGTGRLVLSASGELDVSFRSGTADWTPSPLRTTIDSSGSVLLDRNEGRSTSRWEGGFRVGPTANGRSTLFGGGVNRYRLFKADGALDAECMSQFVLNAGK